MKKQIKVLIGDDSSEFGINCANMLRSMGMYAVTKPKDGAILFETIINSHPDVVIAFENLSSQAYTPVFLINFVTNFVEKSCRTSSTPAIFRLVID